MTQVRKIPHLGLELYSRPKSLNKWHLPVCAASLRPKLDRLRPNHPGNWEEVDFDGCPTLCYVFTGKFLKSLRPLQFHSVWCRFADALGPGPAKEFYPQLWIRYNNGRARARNEWEAHHGGIRRDAFDRGMSVRAAASMSIT